MIKVTDLHKSFGELKVLDGVSEQVEKGCIEMSNRSCAALTCKEVLPSFLRSITYWSYGAETCYYNSL